jgi:hypothetical protein
MGTEVGGGVLLTLVGILAIFGLAAAIEGVGVMAAVTFVGFVVFGVAVLCFLAVIGLVLVLTVRPFGGVRS